MASSPLRAAQLERHWRLLSQARATPIRHPLMRSMLSSMAYQVLTLRAPLTAGQSGAVRGIIARGRMLERGQVSRGA